ncbi:hypothetical protein EDD18DRAFT_1357236 [Armillaria luteobubalina]|uniref:Uncharacterized protein n=1 Tax=Armillaria luteobubalina TaxID=153913 RepID=A0AA39Q000_9AGAR|nr:hypothetical protein EDD18DRAFT_1357236 [Armillaria luteobubalina]
MYHLYLVLKACLDTDPRAVIIDEELDLAVGRKVLDPGKASEYIKKLETAAENIVRAFEKQATEVAGEWDQERFEHLLAEWMVACDQPFEEVKQKEF